MNPRSMDPRSEVVLRQLDYIKQSILLVGLPADGLMSALKQHAAITQIDAWCWLMDDYSQLAQQYPGTCHYGTQPRANAYDQAIIFLPKSKELTEYLLHTAAAHLKPQGELFLVGEKRAGAERAAKQLEHYGKAIKLDSARHCQLWHCRVSQPVQAKPLHEWQNRYQVNVAGKAIEVVSLPGVFSHGRLDKGTELLLPQLDHLPPDDLLDFGCGAGVIGTALKLEYPAQTVHFLDVDAFALAATQLTLQANQIRLDSGVNLIAGRGIADAPPNLGAIISNPPFHQGVHTSYQASEDLLRHSKQHLKAGGQLRIVANSFLKYPPLIEQHLGKCVVLAHGNGFHVYAAARA